MYNVLVEDYPGKNRSAETRATVETTRNVEVFISTWPIEEFDLEVLSKIHGLLEIIADDDLSQRSQSVIAGTKKAPDPLDGFLWAVKFTELTVRLFQAHVSHWRSLRLTN